MEPLLNEPCDKIQILTLRLFADSLSGFVKLFTVAMVKFMMESDHMAGDTQIFSLNQASDMGQALMEATDKVVQIVKVVMKIEGTLTKASYYEALFIVQESLLPAVKTAEAFLGDSLTSNGQYYSEAITEFLAVA
jgi:hypothetical protein